MQINGIRGSRGLVLATLAAALLGFSATAAAQQPDRSALPLAPGIPIPDDYYRAEFVILERIVEPEDVAEQMSARAVDAPIETEAALWTELEDGSLETTLELAPQEDLHLASAVNRLERSGQYRVLASAGWYEAFPPDYQGTPLRVETGDWINSAGSREIKGHITVDRQRYLHINVHLNHWQLVDGVPDTASPDPETTSSDPEIPPETTPDDPETPAPEYEPAPLELLTWIRETRRMRSEEIHFLDSPTIGVLIFFKKVEATE